MPSSNNKRSKTSPTSPNKRIKRRKTKYSSAFDHSFLANDANTFLKNHIKFYNDSSCSVHPENSKLSTSFNIIDVGVKTHTRYPTLGVLPSQTHFQAQSLTSKNAFIFFPTDKNSASIYSLHDHSNIKIWFLKEITEFSFFALSPLKPFYAIFEWEKYDELDSYNLLVINYQTGEIVMSTQTKGMNEEGKFDIEDEFTLYTRDYDEMIIKYNLSLPNNPKVWEFKDPLNPGSFKSLGNDFLLMHAFYSFHIVDCRKEQRKYYLLDGILQDGVVERRKGIHPEKIINNFVFKYIPENKVKEESDKNKNSFKNREYFETLCLEKKSGKWLFILKTSPYLEDENIKSFFILHYEMEILEDSVKLDLIKWKLIKLPEIRNFCSGGKPSKFKASKFSWSDNVKIFGGTWIGEEYFVAIVNRPDSGFLLHSINSDKTIFMKFKRLPEFRKCKQYGNQILVSTDRGYFVFEFDLEEMKKLGWAR